MRFVLVAISALAFVSCGGADPLVDGPTPAVQPPAADQPRRRAARVAPRLELPVRRSSRTLRVPILTYHRIAPAESSLPEITRRLTVDPAEFAREMQWLASHGFQAITQRELFDSLMHRRTLPRKPVVITFDDGYRNVLTYAAPVLARLRMRAIAYVISGRLTGAGPSFLTCPELKRLERLGVEIGSHTVSHRDLRTLTASALEYELAASRRRLECCLAHPVQWFAYPYGGYHTRVVEEVRRAGYVLAATTVGGVLQRAARPLELQRFSILDSTGVAGIAGLLGD
jgi:peptidoglycan/xylan/chitin deacetylase (PgdA/CDA1 family)